MKRIVVLGGGLAGLATAHFFSQQAHVTLVEKTARLGGWVHSIHQNNYLFECGPRGFRPIGKGLKTLALAKKLGLEPIAASHTSKVRYLLKNGRLQPVNLRFLLRHGLLQGCVRDLFNRPSFQEDETLEMFFNRHLGAHFTKTFVDPLTRGIFAGNYQHLSARSCCPQLWQMDQLFGSLLLGRFKKKSSSKPCASLLSFSDGMETLVQRLAQSPIEIRLNSAVLALEAHHVHLEKETLKADMIISALPAHALCPLLGLKDPHLYATISTVNFGWDQPVLPKRGYGFLVPSYEPAPIMGMTWDSEIFPQQMGLTRTCTMIAGSLPEKELIAHARQAMQHFCQVDQEPQVTYVATAHQAIAQYGLGHHAWLRTLSQHLPKNMYALGSSLTGVGINDCICAASDLYESLYS
ncbi:MAG: protoporphyrinogen oxidase [Verrucomicrobia bacterium]|nr:protoporphyrinogen oxidase [Verrucomicrobiota bacterium]MBS0645123.1 protoporphyrinogen oxidase [Verrucomicrobiota bacterium]